SLLAVGQPRLVLSQYESARQVTNRGRLALAPPAYAEAQKFLLGHLSDPEAAAERFAWPQLGRLNWARDRFDAELASGPRWRTAERGGDRAGPPRLAIDGTR